MKTSDAENNTTGTETTDPKAFDFGNYDFQSAGANFTGTTQPKWKFSYDSISGLNIWPVDPVQGRPHHIEVTGMDFYKLAQGRVYVDPDGFVEILMWKDRGTAQSRNDCIDAVDAWLEHTVGKIADKVTLQSEGGYTFDQDGDTDKMMSTYFGYPVKVKADGTSQKV